MTLNHKLFEDKIKPFLTYVGFIGAVLSGIMYLVVTVVLIMGFQTKSFVQSLVFAIVGAVLGMIIFFFLRYQGISFAKALPENQKVLEQYNTKTPKTKYHSLKYFWIKTTIADIVTKGCTVALSTAGIIYIVIEGSQDYKLLLLALANLILFTCLGFIALSNAYDYYNEQYVPYMKEAIEMRALQASGDTLEADKTNTQENDKNVSECLKSTENTIKEFNNGN